MWLNYISKIFYILPTVCLTNHLHSSSLCVSIIICMLWDFFTFTICSRQRQESRSVEDELKRWKWSLCHNLALVCFSKYVIILSYCIFQKILSFKHLNKTISSLLFPPSPQPSLDLLQLFCPVCIHFLFSSV